MSASVLNSQFESVVNNLILQMLTDQLEGMGSTDSSSSDASLNTDWSYEGASGNSSFESLIQAACAKYDVNSSLVNAVIKAESNYQSDAVSTAGAMGLMQLMPGTASGLGVEDPFDPAQNIEGGTKLLSSLLNKYDGDIELTLAAYNAGSGAVARYNGVPPYKETHTYIQRVLNYIDSDNSWSG